MSAEEVKRQLRAAIAQTQPGARLPSSAGVRQLLEQALHEIEVLQAAVEYSEAQLRRHRLECNKLQK